MTIKVKSRQWWETSFDEKYVTTYIDMITPDRTATEMRFILKTLRLKKGARVLDLACGQGRHSVALAARGFRVTGLDYSRHLLALARRAAHARGSAVRFVRGDMRKLSFAGEFDAVINWFTAFGYFSDDADDELVVRGVTRALRPGGRFLLDTINGLMPFVARRTTERRRLSNGLTVFITHKLDPVTMRWKMRRTWRERGRHRNSQSTVRLFVYPQLKHLLESNGLSVERVWGDYDGGPLTADSNRLIVLARKSAR